MCVCVCVCVCVCIFVEVMFRDLHNNVHLAVAKNKHMTLCFLIIMIKKFVTLPGGVTHHFRGREKNGPLYLTFTKLTWFKITKKQ